MSNLASIVSPAFATVGAGGLIDLQQEGYRMPYFRLLYPSQPKGPGDKKWVGVERVATLVGATTIAGIETATEQYRNVRTVDSSNSVVAFSFRGRAAVIPEIAVFVDEHPVWVPVGATVRGVLERFTGVPAAGLGRQDLAAYRGRLRPRRLIHEGVDSTPDYRFMDFSRYLAFPDSTDNFDLPVVRGDRFYL